MRSKNAVAISSVENPLSSIHEKKLITFTILAALSSLYKYATRE